MVYGALRIRDWRLTANRVCLSFRWTMLIGHAPDQRTSTGTVCGIELLITIDSGCGKSRS